ncbi:MAG TPA: DUF6603 domain-containing protein [Bryobacteraceae bacterium]|jgi:hypothetical protein|nr:DUF6603 domain-containing protein [Bryobacteraceae bacterium]
MRTVDLYERLSGKFGQEPFVLNPGDLETLSAQLQVAAAVNAIRCYFPNGTVKLTGRKPVARPAQGKRIEVSGAGSAAPFSGMSVRLELWTEEKSAGTFEVHLVASAYGATPDASWTLGQAIPFYRESLLGGLRFALSDDPQCPFLTLSSHPGGENPIPALHCKGLVELNSIEAATPKLFAGDETKDKYAMALGTMVAFQPSTEAADGRDFRPFVSFFSGMPETPEKRKLGGLFPLENVRYAMTAEPDYNLATYDWEPDCSFLWSADLELKPASSGNGEAASAYKLPLGVEIKHRGGTIRLWSNLTEGVAMAWDALAGCIPGVTLSQPDTGFRVQDHVSLTKLEFIANRTADRGLVLDSISLNVQTNEDKNRWVLIDGLLTLDAIDFFIFVKDPAGTPSIYFSLSGLVGIGEKATLRLTADLSNAGSETDYGFSGYLLEDEPLEINEILTHFLGHSNYPEIPKIAVEDFSFSVRPRSKLYDGEIKLGADWKLTEKLSLQHVYFKLHHGAGEGDTRFEANGVFEIGDTQIYVSADYVSGGQGWTFSGGTFDEEEIPIGDWFKDVWALWSSNPVPELPPAVKDLTLLNLGVRFNTTTGDYSFQGTARFPIDGKTDSASKAELTVQVDREGESATFRGILTLLERDFEVVFNNTGLTGLLVATYDGTGAKPVNLKQLVSEISKTIGDKIADGISIDLAHAQVAFYKTPAYSKFLFGVELGAGIQLSNLPLVGFLFDRDQTLSVIFHLLATSRAFERDEVQAINQLTGPQMTKLPDERIGAALSEETYFGLKAAVNFGGITHQVALPLDTNVGAATDSKKLSVQNAASDKAVYWVKIDKALGPFHFERLGISTDGQALAFLLDASLNTAGLTISLDGLEARCTFESLSNKKFEPSFDLRGLGVAFKNGDLEIGGALVRRRNAPNAFDGALVLRYKQLGIEAVGSYETIDGHPALFVYALINYPLGGPTFFFVEGGAAGFGYNRSLTIPTIDAVAAFPLVQQALAPSAEKRTPLQLAADLRPHVAPAAGQYFFTAGLKFSSFKTIRGFVLVTVLFGDHFEIDVLGKATLTSPPDAAPGKALMSATLLLLGRFLPEQGLLMVMAQLAPDAHLFAPDCHLTGGFAMYCWFEGKNKGDFVVTLGGYHKSFAVPAHYPKVPRLGMNWQVNPNLSLKAEAYFALTPSALMAGGKLEANWKSGDLEAWFRTEIDFLIGWQPFYYEGNALVALGARYRFDFFGRHEISAELTAELNVWGPPFSGRARVQWNLISFEVTFGKAQPKPLPALDWPAFRKSFLPEKYMFTITAEGGTVAQGGSAKPSAGDLGVVNPRTLRLAVRSPLPVKMAGNDILRNSVEVAGRHSVKEPALGIAPMDKRAGQWNSTVSITIVCQTGGNTTEDRTSRFQATKLRSNVPVALWGETMHPNKHAKEAPHLLPDAICGYEIRPSSPVDIQSSAEFAVSAATRNATLAKASTASLLMHRPSNRTEPEVAESLLNPLVRRRRRELLHDLLPNVQVDWGSVTIASWRGTPQIVRS